MRNIARTMVETPARRVLLLIVCLGVLSLGTLRLYNSSTASAAWSHTALRKEYARNLQHTYLQYTADSTSYRIGIIADRDTGSKLPPKKEGASPTWESEMMIGELQRNPVTGLYTINWTDHIKLTSQLNEAGRAMELSELVAYNGQLLAFDDRTGVVSAIDIEKKLAYPVTILMEGDGVTNKGQKNEWAAVKDGKLFVGSIGKEWTNSKGEVVNYNNQWVKELDSQLVTKHVDWRGVYEGLREASHTKSPGYLIHEAVCWSSSRRRWYFMPRRVSELPYDDAADEERCSNTMISLDEYLAHPQISVVGPLDTKHGFSSCKFVPFRENEILTLKTMEFQGTVSSFIAVFSLDGKVLMPETYIADIKFEGVEFI